MSIEIDRERGWPDKSRCQHKNSGLAYTSTPLNLGNINGNPNVPSVTLLPRELPA